MATLNIRIGQACGLDTGQVTIAWKTEQTIHAVNLPALFLMQPDLYPPLLLVSSLSANHVVPFVLVLRISTQSGTILLHIPIILFLLFPPAFSLNIRTSFKECSPYHQKFLTDFQNRLVIVSRISW